MNECTGQLSHNKNHRKQSKWMITELFQLLQKAFMAFNQVKNLVECHEEGGRECKYTKVKTTDYTQKKKARLTLNNHRFNLFLCYRTFMHQTVSKIHISGMLGLKIGLKFEVCTLDTGDSGRLRGHLKLVIWMDRWVC